MIPIAIVLAMILLGILTLRFGSVRILSVVLERQLHVPVQVGEFDLSVFGDSIAVRDLRLGQPEGFGSEAMVTVDKIDLVGWRNVLFSDRRLTALNASDLTINLTTLADGRSNLGTWIRTFVGNKDAADTATPKKTDPFAILVDQISVHGIRIERRDESVGEKPFLLTVDHGTLEIEDLVIGPYPSDATGSMTLHCEIDQPEAGNARITMASRFGPFANRDPSILGSVRVSGCLYWTFVPIIPANSDTLLGGEGFDVDVEFATAAGRILSSGFATTSNGSTYSFTVQGTTDEPVVELPEVLAGVVSRMAGGAGRLVNSTLGTGKEIIVGAVDTVASLGRGMLHATGSLVTGAGSIAAGVVTADGERSQSGFEEMTAETGGHLADAVTDSADAIGETGSRTSDALQNNPEFMKWVSESPQRHNDRTENLTAELERAPFPPVIQSPESNPDSSQD